MVQVHFPLDHEGPRDQDESNGWRDLHGVLHDSKWVNCVRPIKKEVGPMQNYGLRLSIKLPLAPRSVILPWWGPKPAHMLWSLNMTHFYFTLSNCRIGFLFPTVRPLECHGHGSWAVCKSGPQHPTEHCDCQNGWLGRGRVGVFRVPRP